MSVRIAFTLLAGITLSSVAWTGAAPVPEAQAQDSDVVRPWGTAALSQTRRGAAATSAGNVALFAGGEAGTSSLVDVYDADGGTWTTKRFPVARSGSGSARSGSLAFLMRDAPEAVSNYDAGSVPTFADLYDIETESWTAIEIPRSTRVPVGNGTSTFYRRAVASAGTKFLLAGGRQISGVLAQVLDVVDVYDLADGAWQTAALSEPRQDLVGLGVGNLAFFAGGRGLAATAVTDRVDIYDAASDTWSTAALSQPRWGVAAAAAGASVLFAGGFAGPGFSEVVDIYHVSSGEWTTASLSQSGRDLVAVSVGSKILIAGPSGVVDIYDVETGTWSVAHLSVPRRGPVGAATATRALFAGGANSSGIPLDAVDIYDAEQDAWTTTKLSLPAFELAAVTRGATLMFIGGYRGVSDVVDLYDADANQWQVAFLSEPRSHLAATSLGSTAFFAGGFDPRGAASDAIDIFDAVTRQWRTAKLSEPRAKVAATSVGSKVLFAGGNRASRAGPQVPSTASDIVDIYDTTTGEWSTARLSSPRASIAAASVGSVGLFAGGDNREQRDGVDTVDIYDAATGQWRTASLPDARTSISATSVGSLAFFAGGWRVVGNSNLPPRMIDVFDAGTGGWSRLEFGLWGEGCAYRGGPLRPGTPDYCRWQMAAVALGTKAVFAGGSFSIKAQPSRWVDIYDVDSRRWSRGELAHAFSADPVGVAVGDRVLISNGRDVDIFRAGDL